MLLSDNIVLHYKRLVEVCPVSRIRCWQLMFLGNIRYIDICTYRRLCTKLPFLLNLFRLHVCNLTFISAVRGGVGGVTAEEAVRPAIPF